MAKNNKDLKVLFTMLFPVYEDDQGNEEILLTKDINENYQTLGELLYVFPSMTDALIYFDALQKTTNYMFKKAHYVQAFYTEIISFAIQSGTPSGAFCYYTTPNETKPYSVTSIVFPDVYGIDVNRLDTDKNARRILNYLSKPVEYEEFIKRTVSSVEKDKVVDEAYKRANEYLSHFVGLNDDINLLKKYKDAFFLYFQNGRNKALIDIVSKFEYYMTMIEDALKYANDGDSIGDFILSMLRYPDAYKVSLEQKFKDEDPYYEVIAAHATAAIVVKNKRLDEFDEEDLIDLAYMFKTNFPNAYIEMMVDFFAKYALFDVLNYKESDFV